MQEQIRRNVRFNFTMGVLDGAFFGLGMSFASFVTIIPLFMSQLTDSSALIGLVVSLHTLGWQIPQLFIASRVARLPRYKPMAMMMTFHERWPFFGLAVLALLLPTLGPVTVLPLAVLLITIHGLGGGFAGAAWQPMIAKIMPPERTGTFFGTQSGAANLMGAVGALTAGLLIGRLSAPTNFAVCFAIAGAVMFASYFFLARTREPAHEVAPQKSTRSVDWHAFRDILKRDVNFRWFLIARSLSQFGWMAIAFYTVYAVERFGLDERTAGLLPFLIMVAQGVAGPLVGWLGDRIGHRSVYILGMLVMTLSVTLMVGAPTITWVYMAFVLAGLANSTFWATSITLSMQFGNEAERPLYVGLANSLIAPTGLLAPLIGGGLADSFGYQATFGLAIVGGLATAAVMFLFMTDPRRPTLETAQPGVILKDAAFGK